MPELPEVESAMRRLRAAVEGKTIDAVRALHPALKRQLSPAKARRLRQRRITRVERRGKHQLLHLDDGSALHAHFRMNGDWIMSTTAEAPDRFTRAVIELTNGTRIELNDRRALSALTYHPAGENALPPLGIEANDDALDAAYLSKALSARRGPVKPALMDQIIPELGERPAAIGQPEFGWHLFSNARNLNYLYGADVLRRTGRAEVSQVGNAVLRKRMQVGIDRVDMHL